MLWDQFRQDSSWNRDYNLPIEDWFKSNLRDPTIIMEVPSFTLFNYHLVYMERQKQGNYSKSAGQHLWYYLSEHPLCMGSLFCLSPKFPSQVKKHQTYLSASPSAGAIKVKTDGSVKDGSDRSSFGAIMRYGVREDYIGSFYGEHNPCTSLEAKLHAILVGLEILKGMGYLANLGPTKTSLMFEWKLLMKNSKNL